MLLQKRTKVLTMSVRNQLYFAPLEKRLRAQRKSLNKQYELDQIQIAKMNILRESERMQLTKAETMLRIDSLKEELAAKEKLLAEKRATKNSSNMKQETWMDLINQELFVAATPNSNAAIAESLDFGGFPTYTESAYGQPIYADTEAPSEYDDEEEKADPDTVYPIQVSGQFVETSKSIADQAYKLPEGKLYFIEQIPPKDWEKLSGTLNMKEINEIVKKWKVPSDIVESVTKQYGNTWTSWKRVLKSLVEVDGRETRDKYKNYIDSNRRKGFIY